LKRVEALQSVRLVKAPSVDTAPVARPC
jgi:hypothetical protein